MHIIYEEYWSFKKYNLVLMICTITYRPNEILLKIQFSLKINFIFTTTSYALRELQTHVLLQAFIRDALPSFIYKQKPIK